MNAKRLVGLAALALSATACSDHHVSDPQIESATVNTVTYHSSSVMLVGKVMIFYPASCSVEYTTRFGDFSLRINDNKIKSWCDAHTRGQNVNIEIVRDYIMHAGGRDSTLTGYKAIRETTASQLDDVVKRTP